MLKTSIYHNKIILILGFVNSPTLKLSTPGQRHGKKNNNDFENNGLWVGNPE